MINLKVVASLQQRHPRGMPVPSVVSPQKSSPSRLSEAAMPSASTCVTRRNAAQRGVHPMLPDEMPPGGGFILQAVSINGVCVFAFGSQSQARTWSSPERSPPLMSSLHAWGPGHRTLMVSPGIR